MIFFSPNDVIQISNSTTVACQALGANVFELGASLDEAVAAARQLAVDDGKAFCHPFDDPANAAVMARFLRNLDEKTPFFPGP